MEGVKGESALTKPATVSNDNDEDGIGLTAHLSLQFNPTVVLRGGGGTQRNSSIDKDWVVVGRSCNPTPPQSPIFSEYRHMPIQNGPQLRQAPAQVGARNEDRKSCSSYAMKPAPASAPSGHLKPITQAHQVQYLSSSPHVGPGGSPVGVDRSEVSPGGRHSLPPDKHLRQLPWVQAWKGGDAYNAQNSMAHGGPFVEGANLREATGDCPGAVANPSEESSWYQVTAEEAQHVARGSSNQRRTPNGMPLYHEMTTPTREPQFTSIHSMSGITPRQPKYSEPKRNQRNI
jgi:hypothetical protein